MRNKERRRIPLAEGAKARREEKQLAISSEQ